MLVSTMVVPSCHRHPTGSLGCKGSITQFGPDPRSLVLRLICRVRRVRERALIGVLHDKGRYYLPSDLPPPSTHRHEVLTVDPLACEAKLHDIEILKR